MLVRKLVESYDFISESFYLRRSVLLILRQFPHFCAEFLQLSAELIEFIRHSVLFLCEVACRCRLLRRLQCIHQLLLLFSECLRLFHGSFEFLFKENLFIERFGTFQLL